MNLRSFEYYLKSSGLAARTTQENVKDIKRFNEWAAKENYAGTQQMNYNDLLKYIRHMKDQGLSVPTVNIRVNSIRKYYEHLKEEGRIEKNPAKHLHIKGEMKRVTESPFSYTQLEALYNEYTTYSKEKSYALRNLSMLGLMIFQGLHSGELGAMEVQHIKLNTGTAYIPSTRRSNSRELKLEGRQIITLHQYINTLPATQEKLFEGSLHNYITRLTDELKGINPILKNIKHIRASVLLHWLKMYDKRQVQYMAGHRYISSIQHYEVQELDSLTDLLSKHHPFS